MAQSTHLDSQGKALMVDVSDKSMTERTAKAHATVILSAAAYNMVKNNEIKKGDVLTVAKIAGIQAAKRTGELIPLCHNIFISQVDLEFFMSDESNSIEIVSIAKTLSVTGIEMEALTAASIAALTIYDMCKSIDKSIIISNIELLFKSGGKSGTYENIKSGNIL